MLVRQLVGKYAGSDIEMTLMDAVTAHRAGVVDIMDAFVRARFGLVDTDPGFAPPKLAAVVVAAPAEKRRGGWPKGKARGPRKPIALA